MSRILIYTSPARGHLYPIMDTAIALRDAGHDVIVQTLPDERDVVLAAGLEHRAISPEVCRLTLADYTGSNPLAQLRRTLDCWSQRAPHEVADLRLSVAEVAPDLLVVDANCWGAAAFAEGWSGPWAMFLPYVLPVPSPQTPAFGPGFAPPRNALDRLRDRVVWAVQRRAGAPAVTRLNTLRAELGVPPLGSVSDVYQRADALIYLTAEPFEYPRQEWPPGVHQVGPGLWAPPGEEPSWLADLPHPRVLVSVSTEFQDDAAIIDAALAGLSGEPGSVIVTSAAVDPDQFSAAGDNVRIERFLPHAAVVAQMDVVVTHGGMGTVQRALAAGVPLVVVPWGRDQSETARRVARCGAGTVVRPGKLSPERIRDAVREAQSCAAVAQSVAAGFAAAGGPRRAAEVLTGLLPSGAANSPSGVAVDRS
ncbi:MAG: glycosyltransferase [Candidatus Nanopelagicales bacterium]